MSDPFLGQIQQFGFNFPPQGWAQCGGQLLSIAQNTALFALVGTQYGGNGQTTFGLPDLRGRSAINQGQGPSLSNYVIGQTGGTENVTLSTAQLPSHTHPVTNNPAGMNASSSKATAQSPTTGAIFGRSVDNTGTLLPLIYLPAGTTPNVALGLNIAGSIQVGNTGSGTPVSVLSPFLVVNFSIALQGIFPSRN